MLTASWFTHKGPGLIGISRGVPRRTPAGYRLFKQLAPGSWFNSVDKIRYEALYYGEVLGRLDPKETWEKLHALVAPHEPILLCYERPPFTAENWCHRRMAAEWLQQAIGVEIPEFGAEAKQPALDFVGYPPFDPTPWIGKRAKTRDGREWVVKGRCADHPDQAEIFCEDDGEMASVSLETLEAKFR